MNSNGKVSGLKVSELIERLQDMDPDATVAYRYPSGDYWHTEIAKGVARISRGAVKWSGYHEKYSTVNADDDVDDEDGDCCDVVLIG